MPKPPRSSCGLRSIPGARVGPPEPLEKRRKRYRSRLQAEAVERLLDQRQVGEPMLMLPADVGQLDLPELIDLVVRLRERGRRFVSRDLMQPGFGR